MGTGFVCLVCIQNKYRTKRFKNGEKMPYNSLDAFWFSNNQATSPATTQGPPPLEPFAFELSHLTRIEKDALWLKQ